MHAIERFVIHFICSTFLTLGIYFSLYYWIRHNARAGEWISGRDRHLLVTAALVTVSLLGIREPFDMLAGQTFYKALFDIASWWMGAALSAWGLYRFKSLKDGD